MNRTLFVAGIVVVLLAIVGSSSLFTVNEAQQALVVRLGDPRRVIQDPGLKVKLPFVENVVIMDRRVLDLDPPVEQVILADQKRLDVDAFARYRIHDPLRYFQTVGTEAVAVTRLNAVVNSSLRRVLGSVTLLAVLSEERARVMNDIRDQVNAEARRFGIEIVDVRIRRADLPEETSQAIFARMRSEREREASEARAQGQEQAQQIRARAERERTVLLAESQRDAQIQRGEGDNQALRIIADATRSDPQFYAFYRSLEAYRKSLNRDDTTLVLSPGSAFFRFFGDGVGQLTASQRPAGTPPGGAAASPTTGLLPPAAAAPEGRTAAVPSVPPGGPTKPWW